MTDLLILNPCPFCGSNQLAEASEIRMKPHRYYIYCRPCGASGPMAFSIEEAKDKWHTRFSDGK